MPASSQHLAPPAFPRRAFLTAGTAAGLGLAAGLPQPAAAEAGRIVAEEHWAKKGAVDLYLYRKRRVGDGQDGAKPVLFLVHGSTFSSRGSYDLVVPGRTGYSMMDYFAERGFDVWTMDHEGYGFSSHTSSPAGILVGVADLQSALPVVEKPTGKASLFMHGLSSGAIRAADFAMVAPERVERLVLDAFTYTGENAP